MILFYFNRHHDPDRILRQVFAAIIIFCHAAKFTVQTAEDQNFRALGERVWDAFSPCTPFRFLAPYFNVLAQAVMLAALLLSILSAIQYIRRNKGVIDFHDC